MCLLALAWKVRGDWPLLLAANRDEFHRRAAEPAQRWGAGFFAGRDLEAGGTWLGVANDGRFAALTNFRDPLDTGARARSRGILVADYLHGTSSASNYAQQVETQAARFRGFNLLLGDAHSLWYVGSRAGATRELVPGVYGLSNHVLDTPWPKVQRLRQRLESALGQLDPLPQLFEALGDRSHANDDLLPDTGIGVEWERALSAACIVGPEYGTRCSSVLALAARRGIFTERSWQSDGSPDAQRTFEW